MKKYVVILVILFLLLSVPLTYSFKDCTGTKSNPCHCCDVNSMSVKITSPSGSYSQTYDLTYSSSSGTCGSTPEVTETWEKNIGYTFCPEEGTYTAVVTASAAGGDSSCSSYATETSGSYNLYTVNYDSGTDADKWCACKGGTWFPVISDGNNGNCCGDDGVNDMFEYAGTENSACVKGDVVNHNSASSDGRYMVFNGEIYYCKQSSSDTSGYDFITDINSGSSVGNCKCLSDGKWDCSPSLVYIRGGWRGGRIKILG